MKLPKTIDILGITYSIDSIGLINDDATTLGEIAFKEQVIRIKDGMPDDTTTQTLLHEVLHGIDAALGYPLGEGDTSERLVQSLATSLHQTLKGHLTFS